MVFNNVLIFYAVFNASDLIYYIPAMVIDYSKLLGFLKMAYYNIHIMT